MVCPHAMSPVFPSCPLFHAVNPSLVSFITLLPEQHNTSTQQKYYCYLKPARDAGEALDDREVPSPVQDAKMPSARLRLCIVYCL